MSEKYENALKSPHVRAFLYMLAMSEGTEKRHGYNTLVGGGRIGNLSRHPNQVVKLSATLSSSAAGRYQFLSRTWANCQRALGLPDFSPHSQDLAACYLIDGRGGLVPLLKGDVKTAIAKCRKEWASLPGAGYGQGEHSLDKQLSWFNSALKGLGGATASVIDATAAIGGKLPDGGNMAMMFVVCGIGLIGALVYVSQYHK